MLTVGLDLGGTKVLGGLVSAEGEILAEDRVSTPETGDALIEALASLTGTLSARAEEGEEIAAVGVGAAGMIGVNGSVTYGPNVVAFRQGFPLRARLAERLGLPVAVDNDANAAAWGEVVHGAALGHADALVITLGTGIGGGIIAGGRPYRGAHGYAAEIGHFQVVADGPMCACGVPGHWEAMASGTALGRLAKEAVDRGEAPAVLEQAGGDPAAVTGEHVGRAALAGDEQALVILTEFADWVAVGLGGLTNILDPDVIVVGGGLVDLGETLLGRVRDSFWRQVEAPDLRAPVDVVAASLGERAGAIGAAALAREVAG